MKSANLITLQMVHPSVLRIVHQGMIVQVVQWVSLAPSSAQMDFPSQHLVMLCLAPSLCHLIAPQFQPSFNAIQMRRLDLQALVFATPSASLATSLMVLLGVFRSVHQAMIVQVVQLV
jgi:hypothetical protein